VTRGARRRGLVVLFALGVALSCAPGAAAQVQSYGTNDGGGFWSVLPPGQRGVDNALDVGLFQANGQRPAHSSDQTRMYERLVYATPGLRRADLEKYFKDESFGVRPGGASSTYQPGGRADVTVVRDRGFGVPHVYGRTRAGLMFGIGYAQAEDRLFLMDVFRRIGRGEAASFVGGSSREFDHTVWELAPYRPEEYQREFDLYDDRFGPEAAQIQNDVRSFTAGVNRYIDEAKLNPLKMPAEYAALGRPEGARPFTAPDVIASGIVLGAILGSGGGNELGSALALQEAQRRFGRKRGKRVWRDFRRAEDPEAPVTVHRKRFPYQRPPRKVAKGSLAMPDRGSVRPIAPARGASSTASSTARPSSLLPRLDFGRGLSNALLVSARESESGRPLAVFGPQTGYFSQQPLIEMDLHGPGIDARGAVVIGTPYVALGRGRDYAWSATSAGQDYIDTFALPLCEPSGRRPTISSMHYRYRGVCRPIEVLEKRISWTSNLVDSTPSGSEILHAERTLLGIGTARATIKGKPVIYVKLRATYGHEIDRAALAVSSWNDPNRIRSARDYQRRAALMTYTFNWFYADHSDIAYVLGGANPVRARGVDNNLPTWGKQKFEWRGYDPVTRTFAETPFRQRPQVRNQRYIANWNNKQARGFRASDANFSYGSLYRSQLLSDRIKRGIKGRRKMSLTELIDAMEDAGTVDFRGDKVLPWMLRVVGRPRDPSLRAAVARLRAWRKRGSHRIDRNQDRVYEDAEAIRIMDAWWPLWVDAHLRRPLGGTLWRMLDGMLENGIDDHPNGHGAHHGSAFQGAVYGHVQKDLRRLLRRKVKGRFSRIYCGAGGRRRTRRQRLRECRRLARITLGQAVRTPASRLYGGDEVCGGQPAIGPPDPGRRQGNQWCFDAVWFQAASAIEQPLIHWINRPTWQQAVEVERRAPR
jgi:acyl-homoserine lactone acylase PvdQ